MTLEMVMDLRKRVLTGEPVPPEILREAIAFLRQDRMAAAPKKTKKDIPVLDSEALSKLLEMS
jgi:hypothetical protein